MLTIFVKEVNSFFSSLIGYIAMGVFLLVTGLFIWVFPETNALDYGRSDLDSFFSLAPWVLTFLIPAITMRSFSEEFKSGTIELLATRPITDFQIVMGKYLAAFFLVLFTILPTLLYMYTIRQLSLSPGMDVGAAWGSYIGLLLLGASFVAIGIFASAITNNQIVAFLLAVFLCFFCYSAFDYLSELNVFYTTIDHIIEQLGINAHYQSISRGLIDTRDIIYFFSFIAAFLLLTKTVVESRKW